MTTDLAVIEAALKAATPGPWEASPDNLAPDRAAIFTAWCHEGEDVELVTDWCEIPDAHLIALLRNTAAELVERVKAAEAEVERLEGVARKINGQLFDAGYHEAELLAENRAAEATIARVRELADSLEGEWPAGPERDGATVAHLIRQALNRNA